MGNGTARLAENPPSMQAKSSGGKYRAKFIKHVIALKVNILSGPDERLRRE